MLYAGDTIIFGRDAKDFQNNLDMFYKHSELWHLSFNITNTQNFGT